MKSFVRLVCLALIAAACHVETHIDLPSDSGPLPGYPKTIQVLLRNGSKRNLNHPVVVRDSLVGYEPHDATKRIALPLSDVVSVGERYVSAPRTGFAILGFTAAAFIVLVISAVIAFSHSMDHKS